MIRLYLADGTSAPDALCDIEDPDLEVLLDCLDATPSGDGVFDLRSTDMPTHWFVDAEAVDFVEWSGASAEMVAVMRDALARHDGLLEIMWSEMP
jgi:hypothetical protein